ncbi:GGDEF domain-containing protein [Thalassotalea euphylliae]|uniref:GGDEF domain-containing protein n=1 Tax=Thalassotalea euphylliae TaxID=1655234 RepID=UPI0036360E50
MFSAIINLGIENQSSTQVSKIKITNLVSFFTAIIACCYALFFHFELDQPGLMLMNFVFVGAYMATLAMSHFQLFKLGKLWFFMTLMVHVFLLSTQIFSPSSNFHLYYLIIPTGIFVLFDEEDVREKYSIMFVAISLFFATVNYQVEPLIEISPKAEELIFISAVTVIMIEIFIVMSWFSRLMHRYQTRLVTMATKDGLTGIDNRRTFMSVAEDMMTHSHRYNTKLSLVLMDVDHFKKINDNVGHLGGDYVLKQVANLLDMNSRASDKLARYGGEEFVLLLPESNASQANETAENLRKIIEKHIFLYQGTTVPVTMSFGVTEKHIDDIEVTELIKRADGALYEAKEAGRNKVKAA